MIDGISFYILYVCISVLCIQKQCVLSKIVSPPTFQEPVFSLRGQYRPTENAWSRADPTQP